MKLIFCILRDIDSEDVSNGLIQEGYRVTCISSTGGFLRRGQNTLIIGVDDDKVDDAIRVVKKSLPVEIDPNMKRATIFVVNVEKFTQIE
jgi:uncharacterized protein YaaQ